jgi:hypothetical protein
MSTATISTVQCPVLRTPGDLAAHVPQGVDTVVDCSCDPARWAALRARGVQKIIALSRDGASATGADEVLKGDLVTLGAEAGPLDGRGATVLLSDNDLPRYRNPEPYLAAARRVLAPGGLLVLATPNIQYHRAVRALAEEGWYYEESGVWARESLRFFTAIELKLLMAEHGFEALRSLPLRSDPAEAMPLDAQGCATLGRVKLGPLTPVEQQCFLAADIVCLALRPAW